MKKFTAIILASLISVSAFAQEAAQEKGTSAVSINVLGPLVNIYAGSYETALNSNVALKIDLAFTPNLAWITNIGYANAVVHGRYYLGGKAVDGLYLDAGAGASLFFGGYTESFNNYTYSYTGFLPVVMAEIGNKFIFGGRSAFYLEPFLGWEQYFGTAKVTVKNASGTEVAGATATVPSVGGFRYGFNLGWAF